VLPRPSTAVILNVEQRVLKLMARHGLSRGERGLEVYVMGETVLEAERQEQARAPRPGESEQGCAGAMGPWRAD